MFAGGYKPKMRLIRGEGGAAPGTPAQQNETGSEQQNNQGEFLPGMEMSSEIFGLPMNTVLIGGALIITAIIIMAVIKKGGKK
jgi:hypothetical protein